MRKRTLAKAQMSELVLYESRLCTARVVKGFFVFVNFGGMTGSDQSAASLYLR